MNNISNCDFQLASTASTKQLLNALYVKCDPNQIQTYVSLVAVYAPCC